MATWKSAAELSRRYQVGPERLLDYSRRGNLPTLREEGSLPLFDEDFVARFFRRRQAMGTPVVHQSHLGVLGEARLGAHVLPTMLTGREARRRAIRLGKSPSQNDSLRRAG